jgi:hypothetical protein
MAIQFNANTTLDDHLIMYRIAEEKYLVISKEPFYDYSIGTMVDASIEHRFIAIDGDNLNSKVSCVFDKDQWKAYFGYFYAIDGGTRTTTAFKAYVEGTEVSVTGNSTLATLVTNINTALNTSLFWATYQGTDIYLYGPGTVDSFDIVLGDSNTLVIDKVSTPTGAFPTLTYDDIFARFLNRPDDGALAGRNPNAKRPVSGGIYRKHTLTTQFPNANFTGPAGAMGTVQQIVELYVLKSQATALIFKATGNNYMDETTPSAADTSLDTLIRTTLFA